MFGRLNRWALSIDWRRIRQAAVWAALVTAFDWGVIWWQHTDWADRLFTFAAALGCAAAFYFGSWSETHTRERRHRFHRVDRRPRVMPPGPSLVEEVYTALRNLEYPDTEARRAIRRLRSVDLVDFDTAFRAAMQQLQSPHRAV